VPKLFSPAQLKELREQVPQELSAEQTDRVRDALKSLNEAPLSERLLSRLREDGVPISDHEIDLLDELKAARNAAVHGRHVAEPPSREQVNYGLSLVARMLVHRAARMSGSS